MLLLLLKMGNKQYLKAWLLKVYELSSGKQQGICLIRIKTNI
jgi:hypothetical protein